MKLDEVEKQGEGNTGTIDLEPTQKIDVRQPKMYQVVLHNDDYTPFEFVMHVLVEFFKMDSQKAWAVMMTAHTSGKVVCGVYPKDIAETKAVGATEYAKTHEHPLVFEAEPVD